MPGARAPPAVCCRDTVCTTHSRRQQATALAVGQRWATLGNVGQRWATLGNVGQQRATAGNGGRRRETAGDGGLERLPAASTDSGRRWLAEPAPRGPRLLAASGEGRGSRRRHKGDGGIPGRTRTCNPRFRRPMLYPIELREHRAPLNPPHGPRRKGPLVQRHLRHAPRTTRHAPGAAPETGGPCGGSGSGCAPGPRMATMSRP